jgi:hypothetical protein
MGPPEEARERIPVTQWDGGAVPDRGRTGFIPAELAPKFADRSP